MALGEDTGRLAVVGWGSTYGPIHQAVRILREEGHSISHIHIRYLKPFPQNLGKLLRGFDRILVPEMNAGQLVTVLRAEYLVDAQSLSKVTGKPFKISELVTAFRNRLEK
jgi:2-oxoglutarate ferredoxin oxidoreductase subunit alpha